MSGEQTGAVAGSLDTGCNNSSPDGLHVMDDMADVMLPSQGLRLVPISAQLELL